MRYKLFVLFIAVVSFLTSAKSIHWIIASDVKDSVIGGLNINGCNALIEHFINPVSIVADSLGYNSFIYKNDSTNFTPYDVVSTIKNINSSDEDILVLYYIGHGCALPKEKDSEFPLLVMNSDEFGLIEFDFLNQALAKKKHKAVLSIAVASNIEIPNMARIQNFNDPLPPNKGIEPFKLENIHGCYLTDVEFRNIENGIKHLKGEFHVTSAKRGYNSYGGNTPLGSMDLYTYAFISCFEDQVIEGGFSWLETFCDTADIVDATTEGNQKPYLQLTISKND